MASKAKDFNLSINPGEVMFTSINTSKDGYNSARMIVKRGDKEYMSISYEWEGAKIPGFAMDLMAFMKSNNKETSGIWEGKEEVYEEYSCKTCKKHNPEKSEKCSECGEMKEKCKCKK